MLKRFNFSPKLHCAKQSTKKMNVLIKSVITDLKQGQCTLQNNEPKSASQSELILETSQELSNQKSFYWNTSYSTQVSTGTLKRRVKPREHVAMTLGWAKISQVQELLGHCTTPYKRPLHIHCRSPYNLLTNNRQQFFITKIHTNINTYAYPLSMTLWMKVTTSGTYCVMRVKQSTGRIWKRNN